MPILPSRTLKRYTSLPTEPPESTQRPKVQHSLSAPQPGSKLVNALLNFRRRSEEDQPVDTNSTPDIFESFESEPKVESTSHKKMNSSLPMDASERPRLTPYFENKTNRKDLMTLFEKQKTESDKEEYAKQVVKKPTLNPFFNANHSFIKSLRRMESKVGFNKLKTDADD